MRTFTLTLTAMLACAVFIVRPASAQQKCPDGAIPLYLGGGQYQCPSSGGGTTNAGGTSDRPTKPSDGARSSKPECAGGDIPLYKGNGQYECPNGTAGTGASKPTKRTPGDDKTVTGGKPATGSGPRNAPPKCAGGAIPLYKGSGQYECPAGQDEQTSAAGEDDANWIWTGPETPARAASALCGNYLTETEGGGIIADAPPSGGWSAMVRGFLAIRIDGSFYWQSEGGKEGTWEPTGRHDYPLKLTVPRDTRTWYVGVNATGRAGSIWITDLNAMHYRGERTTAPEPPRVPAARFNRPEDFFGSYRLAPYVNDAVEIRITVNANGTWSWSSQARGTYTGRWRATGDPDAPIALEDAVQKTTWKLSAIRTRPGIFRINDSKVYFDGPRD